MKKEKWSVVDIGSQQSKVVIVTGASSGIGFETAKMLAAKGAKVIMAVRNRQKGTEALAKMKGGGLDGEVSLMELDLANLDSVQDFSEHFRRDHNRLDLLVNNAGVMIPPYSQTKDNFELQMGTNYFGHFALTGHLFDLLIKTQQSRVVNVSSLAHDFGKLDFTDLHWQRRKYKKWQAYGDSKIASLYFTYQLAKRYSDCTGIKFTAAHPGWTATELQRHTGFVSLLNNIFAQNIAMGALPSLRAATDEKAKSGTFFGPSGFKEIKGHPVRVESNKLSHDDNIGRKLWQTSEQLTGVRFPSLE